MKEQQSYITTPDDRPVDEIWRVNPTLAGVVAHQFVEGTTDHAYIYTTETLADEKAAPVLASEGDGDAVT